MPDGRQKGFGRRAGSRAGLLVRHAVLERVEAQALQADPINLSPARLESLRRQVEARLRPALRPADFEGFDLERAVPAWSGSRKARRPGPLGKDDLIAWSRRRLA
jgi:hypothetical protein